LGVGSQLETSWKPESEHDVEVLRRYRCLMSQCIDAVSAPVYHASHRLTRRGEADVRALA
jgi:hypothetical protein